MAAGPDDDSILVVTSTCRIPLSELVWTFGPSGGPGGQHANRAHTRAEVRFDIAGSPSLGASQRERLLEKLGPVVVVAADGERSQLRNRAAAQDRLRRRLAAALHRDPPRRATRPSRSAVERRLRAKRNQSDRKAQRRRPGRDD